MIQLARFLRSSNLCQLQAHIFGEPPPQGCWYFGETWWNRVSSFILKVVSICPSFQTGCIYPRLASISDLDLELLIFLMCCDRGLWDWPLLVYVHWNPNLDFGSTRHTLYQLGYTPSSLSGFLKSILELINYTCECQSSSMLWQIKRSWLLLN